MQLSKSSGHRGHLRLLLGLNGPSFKILKNDVDRFAEETFYICDLSLPLHSCEHTCELGGVPGAGHTRRGGEATSSASLPGASPGSPTACVPPMPSMSHGD